MQFRPTLPGGEARRPTPSGLQAGVSRAAIPEHGKGEDRGSGDGSPAHPPVAPSAETTANAARALAVVAAELLATESTLRALVGSDVGAVSVIATYLADSGGKRLRPALTALGARAVGVTDVPIGMMCAGELIHLGSLLHDDVVDQGDVRRGRPSAHVVYGNAVSVLTGDFCVARALLAAGETGGAENALALARTVAEMAEGEVLQLQRAGDLNNTLETYLDIIDRKAASLIAWCCSAGARLVGDKARTVAMERFGRGIGRAFQIADDVLDYRATTDKLPGADLRERKVTLPLLYAMDRLDGLRERLTQGPLQAGELGPLLVRIRASGALEDALADARRYVDDALDALDALEPSDARDALRALAAAVVERTS